MFIDHIGLGVADYPKSKAFYAKALAPLGAELIAEFGPEVTPNKVWACGFGRKGKPELWLGSDGKTTPPTHIAFLAENREQVRAFYEAAIAAGGKDNGGPGIREIYHPHYYGAFVLDLDGHNIEAVCHNPE
jgi:catechol 2,3-dioxygenase-like lactoylglutathione lyase family enzyme